jgi:hypothetical protein
MIVKAAAAVAAGVIASVRKARAPKRKANAGTKAKIAASAVLRAKAQKHAKAAKNRAASVSRASATANASPAVQKVFPAVRSRLSYAATTN